MKASEARRLTEKNFKVSVIKPLLDFVYGKIKETAEKGESSLLFPFNGYYNGNGYVKKEETAAVYRILKGDGFEIIEHPDPDPGHPCSHPYDEIRW